MASFARPIRCLSHSLPIQPIASSSRSSIAFHRPLSTLRASKCPLQRRLELPYERHGLLGSIAHRRWNASSSDPIPGIAAPEPGVKSQPIGQIQPRLQMTFTCTHDDCGHRSTHEFARRSYERGLVLVQCPECKARHLIADHIGWFKESTEEGKLKTVEDLLRAKGEKIKKGKVNFDGDIEYFEG